MSVMCVQCGRMFDAPVTEVRDSDLDGGGKRLSVSLRDRQLAWHSIESHRPNGLVEYRAHVTNYCHVEHCIDYVEGIILPELKRGQYCLECYAWFVIPMLLGLYKEKVHEMHETFNQLVI